MAATDKIFSIKLNFQKIGILLSRRNSTGGFLREIPSWNTVLGSLSSQKGVIKARKKQRRRSSPFPSHNPPFCFHRGNIIKNYINAGQKFHSGSSNIPEGAHSLSLSVVPSDCCYSKMTGWVGEEVIKRLCHTSVNDDIFRGGDLVPGIYNMFCRYLALSLVELSEGNWWR